MTYFYYRYVDNKWSQQRAFNHIFGSGLIVIFYQALGLSFFPCIPFAVVLLYKSICYIVTKLQNKSIDWMDYLFDAVEWIVGGLIFGGLFWLFI